MVRMIRTTGGVVIIGLLVATVVTLVTLGLGQVAHAEACSTNAHGACRWDADRPSPVHLNGWHKMRNGQLRVLFSDRHHLTHLNACRYEDSVNCWWDAARGNHRGHSFAAVLRRSWTCIAYLDPYYATHDRCVEGH